MRKNFKSDFSSNKFCFLGHKCLCCIQDKFMLGINEETAKIYKTGLAKLWHTAVSKPQWVGFLSKKTGCDEFES